MSQSDGGDNSSYDRERQQLLDEFAAALRARHENPGSEPWFSEDDLVDVFDFAGDVGNDYLRAEALMWGARTFPESERLFERRGVFYSDVLSDKDVEEFMQLYARDYDFSRVYRSRKKGCDVKSYFGLYKFTRK